MIYKNYHPMSTNLRVTVYNTDTKILRVLFKSGYLYFFYGVPKSVFDAIGEGVPRGGKIFWRRLARNYPYRAINRSYSTEV